MTRQSGQATHLKCSRFREMKTQTDRMNKKKKKRRKKRSSLDFPFHVQNPCQQIITHQLRADASPRFTLIRLQKANNGDAAFRECSREKIRDTHLVAAGWSAAVMTDMQMMMERWWWGEVTELMKSWHSVVTAKKWRKRTNGGAASTTCVIVSVFQGLSKKIYKPSLLCLHTLTEQQYIAPYKHWHLGEGVLRTPFSYFYGLFT